MTTLFRVLGAVEVLRGEPPSAVALGGAQQRRLLAMLLTDPGKVVPLARIVDVMWPYGEPPDAARGRNGVFTRKPASGAGRCRRLPPPLPRTKLARIASGTAL